MAKDKKNKGQRGGGQLEQGIVTDPRFARMHNDPRFRKFPKNANKVEIDERFKGMFEDADFQGVAVVDKRGRKVAPSRRKGQDLKRYYRLKDEDEWKQGAPAQEDDSNDDNGDDGGDDVTAPITPTAQGKAQGKKEKASTVNKAAGKAAGKKKALDVKTGKPAAGKASDVKATAKAVTGEAAGKAKAAHKKKQPVVPSSDEEDDEEDDKEDDEQQHLSEEGEEEGEEQEEEEMDEAQRRWARARGLIDSGSSSDSHDSDDEDSTPSGLGTSDDEEGEVVSVDSADEALDPEEWGIGAMAANPEEEIPACDPTPRLALVDLDWRQLSATDILAALRSFCPPGGRVERVTVYPSDYGLEQMAAEREAGPRAVFSEPGQVGSVSDGKVVSVSDMEQGEEDEGEDGEGGGGALGGGRGKGQGKAQGEEK